MALYQVRLRNITAGIETTDGVVTDAAPVFRSFLGQRLERLERWIKEKGGKIYPVPGPARKT